MENNKVQFYRVNSDNNGNPRYVCHYLVMADNYNHAIKLANSIGGRKFHNKQFGGGLVFQAYSLDNLVMHINRVTGKQYTGYIKD